MGDDSSYIGLGLLDIGEDGCEVDRKAAVQDAFEYWIHVDDSIADG